MAIVTPINRNSVDERPATQARLQAADFGAGGEAIGRAAANLGVVGADYAKQKNEQDIIDARIRALDADNKATVQRQALYHEGENAFFNLQGRNALNATADLNAERDRIDREAVASLGHDPLAAQMYGHIAGRRRIADDELIDSHLNTQRTAYQNSVDDSAIRVAAGTAANNADNPDEVTRGITTATSVAEQRAHRLGLTDPDQIRTATQAAASIVVAQVAERIEQRSPSEAMAFIEVHKAQIDPFEYTRLRSALQAPAAAEHADENVDPFIVIAGSTPTPGTAPPAPPAPPTPPGAPAPVRASGPAGTVAAVLNSGSIPPNVVAGFLGNIHQESGFSNARSGDGGTAHGFVQWRDERVANFRRVIGVDPGSATAAQQAQFILYEMQHPAEAGMTVEQRDMIMHARTPEEASQLIDRYYERSSGQARAERAVAARQYAGGTAATPGTTTDAAGPPEIDLQATIARINSPDARNPQTGEPLTYPERQALIAAASRRHSLVAQTRQESEQRIRDDAYQAMIPLGDNFTDYNQLPLTVRTRLDTNPHLAYELHQIAQTNREQAERRAAAGPPANSPQMLDLLEAAYGTPEQRAAFMRQDPRSTSLNIAASERARLIELQGGMRTEQQHEATNAPTREGVNIDRVRTYVSRLTQAVDPSLLGFDGRPTHWTPDQRQNYISLMGRVVDRVRTEQAQAHRQLNDEELQRIVASETRPVTVVTQGFIGQSRQQVPGYRARAMAQTNPSYVQTEIGHPAGVPDRDAEAIIRAYRIEHPGAYPTDQMITEIWQRRQGAR